MSRTSDKDHNPPPDPIAPLRAALRGRYEIDREIGQGAFATVYLARDLKHEREVAIKVLNADPSTETSEIRFIREIRMLAKLQHPNILPLHDSGHVEALLYYVMPHVSGETLRDKIGRLRQLPVEDAACIAQEAADALACAHSQGIVHRDIKPENILLSGGHAIVSDFGIARAIDIAGIKHLTRPGLGSPGTPAYMAPEQLLGEVEIDARADTYSLGCVFFEMLTGKPPFGGKEGFVKRFTEPPPTPSALRRDLPEWADTIVSTSLARNPADRYPSASHMARALALGLARERTTPVGSPVIRVSSPSTTRPTEAIPSGPGRVAITSMPPASSGSDALVRKRNSLSGWVLRGRELFQSHRFVAPTVAVIVAAIVLAASLGGTRAIGRAFGSGAALDSTRFVVLPLAGAAPSEQLARQVTNRLYEAFRGWDGLNLVPAARVDDAIAEFGRAPANLHEAQQIATTLGARHLVWGRIVIIGDSIRPRAELYDVAQPDRSTREIVLDARGGDEAYANAVLRLLAPPGRPAAALGGDGRTRNYAAWQAYNRGHLALASWDLERAHREFVDALGADRNFVPAQLWVGQLIEWRNPAQPEEWRQFVVRASGATTSLSERDGAIASALAAMAVRHYPAACEKYRGLTTADSTDFVGWYGLGQCHGLDGAVLANPASPSGWMWRSSYHASVESFRRALLLEPRAFVLLSYDRLRRLLPTTALNLRVDNPGSPRFAAYPSLSADTVAFVPYPITAIDRGLAPEAISTRNAALSRNLDVLFSMVKDWVRVYPKDPDAHEALADVLESRGDIFDRTGAPGAVLIAIKTAAQLSEDATQRTRLALREARIRFKRGDFAGTRKVADSVFSPSSGSDESESPDLISLAALTGRIQPMAREARRVVIPESVEAAPVPPRLADAAADLFAASALGVCGDTLAALRRAVEQQAQSSVAEDKRASVVASLTARPLSFMVPCTGGATALEIAPSTNRLYALQKAFARKDRAGVQAKFSEIAQATRSLRPGDLSLDYTYEVAWVRAATGDTAGAVSQLDRALNGLPALSASGLREPAAAAAAGRAMILRAELAARTGDARTARRWAAAVVELWRHADSLLQPTVARMAHLARSGRLP